MTEIVEPSHGPIAITEGEWSGWSTWKSDAFEQTAGPFYEKQDTNGDWICAFVAEQRHMNGAGFMHGGCLMTFADAALFTIARNEMRDSYGVTMNLTGDFLAAGKVGQRIEGRGEVTRGGGKTVFVRGIVTGDGTPLLSFSGIIRKTGKRADRIGE